MDENNPNPEQGSFMLCSRLDSGPLYTAPLSLSLSPLARIKHAILLNYPCKQAPGREGERAREGEKSLQPLENKKLSFFFSTVLQIKMRGRGSLLPPLPNIMSGGLKRGWNHEVGIQHIMD